MNEEKDYSLLRPFDLEAAKGGALLCDFDLKIALATQPLSLVAVAGKDGDHAVRDADGNLWIENAANLRMHPLCWVEGKPVYKGDVLFNKEWPGSEHGEFKVSHVRENSLCSNAIYCERGTWLSPEGVTWEAPRKPLCEVEGKPVFAGDRLFHTRENAWWVAEGTKEVCLISGRLEGHPGDDGNGLWAPSVGYLTWTPPPVKREGWVNIYPAKLDGFAAEISQAHETPRDADESAGSNRIACVRIEWEEPASC